jgi:hypothetical protein
MLLKMRDCLSESDPTGFELLESYQEWSDYSERIAHLKQLFLFFDGPPEHSLLLIPGMPLLILLHLAIDDELHGLKGRF